MSTTEQSSTVDQTNLQNPPADKTTTEQDKNEASTEPSNENTEGGEDDEEKRLVRIAKINVVVNAAVPLPSNDPTEEEIEKTQKEANRKARIAAHGVIDEMAEKGSLTQTFDTTTEEGKQQYERFNDAQDGLIKGIKEVASVEGGKDNIVGLDTLDQLGSGFEKSLGAVPEKEKKTDDVPEKDAASAAEDGVVGANSTQEHDPLKEQQDAKSPITTEENTKIIEETGHGQDEPATNTDLSKEDVSSEEREKKDVNV